jgi:phenylalanyl-tRNA synthetase alpha chain
MKLPETQVAVLEVVSADDPTPVETIAEQIDEQEQAVTRAAFELEADDLVDVEEVVETDLVLTEEGETYVYEALPEHSLWVAALSVPADDVPAEIGQLAGRGDIDEDEIEIALSNFARKGMGEIEEGRVTADPDFSIKDDSERALMRALSMGDVDRDEWDETTIEQLLRRSLIEERERTIRRVTLTEAGVTALMEGVEAAETVGQITPELLTSGEWEDVKFAEYNVEAPAETTHGGRYHPLRGMAERVKDVFVGMGFEEMEGPHVDADFYINDCLFMPQDHPARTHWDRFALESPEKIDEDALPADLVERVRSAHLDGVGPDGEGYHSPWDLDFARALALRGHTTSLSVRYLAGIAGEDVEPPQRYFSVEKAYRNDTLDATHLLEFFQIEGWVMAEDLSVRDLQGTFTEFYEQFGITDLEFKPTYNPYTEPSFELFGHHPETGELIEIGNSGIFRPEMLEPMDIEADVMAWGLALERLLMLATGAEDIRDVHGTLVDLDFLRSEEVVY